MQTYDMMEGMHEHKNQSSAVGEGELIMGKSDGLANACH